MSEEEHTPQEWAQELGVELHGMTDERWDAYLRYLEEKDELTEASKRVLEEAKDLHAAFHADKFVRPQNQEQRRRLWRSLRELRTRRLADLRARYEAVYDEGDDHD
jgi:DnaJ-domain-containing protein 1